jgi:dipeptidyl aminopeptidase/acylaminoacyl peptidase
MTSREDFTMSRTAVPPLPARRFRRVLLLPMLFLAGGAWLLPVLADDTSTQSARPVKGANFKQAYKYSNEFLRQFVYSTSVQPNWIGKTDVFWYEYRTSKGKQWYRVDPQAATKTPLFDRVKLGAQLSEQVHKPLEPQQLPLTRVALNDEGTKVKFVTDNLQFEYDLKTEKLTKLGKAPPMPVGPAGMSPAQLERMKEMLGEERYKEFLEQQKKQDTKKDEKQTDKQDDGASDEEAFADLDLYVQDALAALGGEDEAQQKKGFGKGFGKGGFKGGTPEVYSPDKKMYAYSMNNNLFLAEGGKDGETVQLTKDGAEQYSFAGGLGFGGFGKKGGEDKDKKDTDKKDTKDKKVRPSVNWSKDSKAFYATRNDSRNIRELFLINSIDNPRPTLRKYPYPMPGEENIRKTELHIYHVAKKKLVRIEPKWKDESYTDIHWGKSSDELRFVRRDRLVRSAEFCTLNMQTGECKCLILDGFENAHLETKPMRYLDESSEMVWWSERSNWGHFYLYDRGGTFKNAITAGDFRASAIVAIDTKNRQFYFRGNAREAGENVYQNHLYCVHLDGTGLTLMDPGNGNHDSHLSPTKQYVVDNCSRFDAAPVSVLRDARGTKVMDLERTDLSKLRAVGWRMPETFIVKAADGVTDLYGHLWKPFDFDPKKKYPVIANVYPGPQTESMTHSFQPITPMQQLAQLNFIVIQVGNRGGSPLRSKAYQAHSYWNMRDYGLADKKTAIEQLAARFGWIDIDRVGIYGHSGGGFMSAAALLVKPYNDFFKVAVSSAGNHDNNIYNNSWAERYHGLKEVPANQEVAKTEETKKGFGKGGFRKKGAEAPPDDDEAQDKEQKKAKEEKKDTGKKEEKKDAEKKDEKTKEATRFDIKVPTNPELAANLKGKLLLVHGDMDNNVHPANTIRLADALIKANKRFDLIIMPGKAHGFAEYQPYFTQRMWEYFAEHLLDDHPSGADIYDRRDGGR